MSAANPQPPDSRKERERPVTEPSATPPTGSVDFIREIILEHNRTGRFGGRVHAKWVGETQALPWTRPLDYPFQ